MTKQLPKQESLDKLEPLGLAIWFQDAGSYNKKKKRFELSTGRFTIKDNGILKNLLKKNFNIQADILFQDGYPILSIPHESNNARRFQKIIEPWIHPSMYYKLNPAWYYPEDLERYQKENFSSELTFPIPPDPNEVSMKLDRWLKAKT